MIAIEIPGSKETCDSCGDPADIRIAVSLSAPAATRDTNPGSGRKCLVLRDECADGAHGLTEQIQDWC